MATIISSSSFNPSNFTAPGLYINNVPPPSYIKGAPTNVGFVVGTASWGALNAPEIMSQPEDATAHFGGITAASLADAHDLCTDATIAFQQGYIQLWGVRISDGTDVAATNVDSTGGTIAAVHTGSAGNTISITYAVSNKPSAMNVTVSAGFNGDFEVFPNIPSSSGAAFWTALQNAFLNGVNGVRGPSRFVRISSVAATPTVPSASIVTLTGGTDGTASVTSADLLGQDQTYPATGFYLANTLNPYPLKAWIAGLTDETVLADMVAFCEANAIYTTFAFPTGTTTSALLTDIAGYGIATYQLSYLKDWIYWNDPVNGVVRLVAPYPFAMGLITALSPAQSPLNKAVNGVVGTERNSPYSGNVPYSQAEIGQLQQAGVLVITNPIPQGNIYGFATGTNTASNPAESPVEYASTTNFLDMSLGQTMGSFVGKLQSEQKNDPLRRAVRHQLNTFLHGLVSAGLIDAVVQVTCDFAKSGSPQLGINTPATIAQHYLYAYAAVRYLSSVWYFVISAKGGTTVISVSPGA